MTEFDFDELDKAVNSLMKKTPGDDEVSDAPENVVALSPSSEQPTETPVSQFPVTTSESSLPAVPSPDTNQPVELTTNSQDLKPVDRPVEPVATNPARPEAKSLVTRRRGTFMDVVHPSSDMRNASKTNTVSSRPTSRQGVAIAPLETPTAAIEHDIDNTPTPTPTQQLVSPRSVDDRQLVTTLADAVSHETTASKPEDTPVDIEDANNLMMSDSPAMPSVQETTSMQSPDEVHQHDSLFISDAKVDKRPLGAHPTAASAEVPTHPPVGSKLPDELSGQILAIESEKTVTNNVQTPATQAAPSPDAPMNKVASNLAASSTTASKTIKTNLETDEDHPAIYDPAYYQQESNPVTKKKSGWGVVLAIVGLIVLGGAGGVLYYFYSTGAF